MPQGTAASLLQAQVNGQFGFAPKFGFYTTFPGRVPGTFGAFGAIPCLCSWDARRTLSLHMPAFVCLCGRKGELEITPSDGGLKMCQKKSSKLRCAHGLAALPPCQAMVRSSQEARPGQGLPANACVARWRPVFCRLPGVASSEECKPQSIPKRPGQTRP